MLIKRLLVALRVAMRYQPTDPDGAAKPGERQRRKPLLGIPLSQRLRVGGGRRRRLPPSGGATSVVPAASLNESPPPLGWRPAAAWTRWKLFLLVSVQTPEAASPLAFRTWGVYAQVNMLELASCRRFQRGRRDQTRHWKKVT